MISKHCFLLHLALRKSVYTHVGAFFLKLLKLMLLGSRKYNKCTVCKLQCEGWASACCWAAPALLIRWCPLLFLWGSWKCFTSFGVLGRGWRCWGCRGEGLSRAVGVLGRCSAHLCKREAGHTTRRHHVREDVMAASLPVMFFWYKLPKNGFNINSVIITQ